MQIVLYTLLAILPLAFLTLSIYTVLRRFMAGQPKRSVLTRHFVTVGGVVLLMGTLAFAASADPVAAAETAGEVAAANQDGLSKALIALAAALSMGVSGIGAGLAIASAAPAAIAATSENPAAFAKSMILVALGEAIAIYGLVISIMILGNM
ncbi:MAG: ATP synthase subunit C [Oscillospiraceae bacterium]|jgi:V/A-type H+-transporting ATPase subunit K|nr:ATP synthase subunit C [Oscillospiraceae bacterium]